MGNQKIKLIDEPDKIINYWKKEKLIVACIFIFGVSFNVLTILGPIYQGKLVDSVVNGYSLQKIINLAIIFIGLICTIQILRYFKRFYIRRFANITSVTMRLMIYNSIVNKTITDLDKENIGNLMTRIISDVDLCVEGMRKFTTEIFDTGILMSSYFITLLVYDVKTTLVSVIFVPIAMFLAEKLKIVIYKYSIDYRTKSSEVTQLTYDAIENAMLYRVNSMEHKNLVAYEQQLDELQNKAIKANVLENSMPPIYNAIAMAGIVTVIYFCGMNVINGVWTVGMFSTYIAIFTALAIKSSKAAKLFNSVQKSQVSWKRVKPYLTEYKIKSTDCHISTDNTELTIKNLGFSYLSNIDIIRNINFGATQGDIIGITGRIASGKSTLGLALTGIYDYKGSITIDKKQLRDYTAYERSCMVSYLGHNSQLLSDSIYNNITLGENLDITNVLKDVCFDQDLDAMPKKEQTLIGNSGIRLSGGQQARIALARTLINHNKIIILDDPFSAVDTKTEQSIIENLKQNYKDSIIIIISHRLKIFNKMTNVILINADKQAYYGTHDELMEKSSFYADIYNLQNIEGGNDE